MIKVLALDLDGTVLNSKNAISGALRDKIHALKEIASVVLVTGRHHTAAKPYHHELGLNTPIICCNGSYVYDYSNARVIEHNAIDKTHAKEFIRLAEANNLNLVMYAKDAMLHSQSKPITYMQQLSNWAMHYSDELRPDIRCVASFVEELDKTEHVWKFVIEGNDVAAFDSLDFVRDNFSGERSWVDRIDYAKHGNNKGSALAQYVSSLGLGAQQVAAIGDNHNDISMLKYAGLGVAMLNADDIVKQSAQLTTLAGNDDARVLADLIDEIFQHNFSAV